MLIDITRPLSPQSLVYPGDPKLVLTRLTDVLDGHEYSLTHLSCGLHTGTHLDAPRHFFAEGATVDELPLSSLICHAHVIDVGDAESITPRHFTTATIQRGQALLFKTRNSLLPQDEMAARWTYLTTEAALTCAQRGAVLVGIDYLDPEHPLGVKRFPVHKTLLAAGILLLENIDLREAEPGEYELICLPLKIAGAEASPCRAILRTLS